MKRRNILILAAAALLTVGLGAAFWLALFPPWTRALDVRPPTPPLEKLLLGAWEGAGEFSGDWSIDIKSDPKQAGPAGKASGRMTSVCTVQAEFKPDGTYIWKEHLSGGGFNIDVRFPRDDASPARWEVVRAQGNQLTVRIYFDHDAVIEFQGENAFTMALPDPEKGSGTYTFRRSAMPQK